MTTVHSAPRKVVHLAADDGSRQDRWLRRQRRRRLLREQLLAVTVLVLALAATLAVLAMQWLGSGSSANAISPTAGAYTIFGGPV
jgi:hypothetical protein